MSKKNIPPIQALIEVELAAAGFFLGLQDSAPKRKSVVFYKKLGDIVKYEIVIELLPYGPSHLGLFIRVSILLKRPPVEYTLDGPRAAGDPSCMEYKYLTYNLSRLYEHLGLGPTVVIDPLDKSSAGPMVSDLLRLATLWLSNIRDEQDALSHSRSFEGDHPIRSSETKINQALFWACAAYYCLKGDQFWSEVDRIDAWLSRIAPAAKRDGYLKTFRHCMDGVL